MKLLWCRLDDIEEANEKYPVKSVRCRLYSQVVYTKKSENNLLHSKYYYGESALHWTAGRARRLCWQSLIRASKDEGTGVSVTAMTGLAATHLGARRFTPAGIGTWIIARINSRSSIAKGFGAKLKKQIF